MYAVLTSERFLDPRPSERREADTLYETPLATVQRILEADTELTELQIVRTWLQEQLPALHTVEVRKGYLPFTKNAVRAAKRTQLPSGLATRRKNEGLVQQLDPDAALRGPGTLDVEDVNYEKALVRALFEYVRAGELDKALHLCTQTSQPWRAASLRGALFYHDPSLGEPEMEEPMGNRLRGVWRRVAEKAAINVGGFTHQTAMDPYERALYGALSGQLSSVLSVSETWEEQLWGYINARFEQRLQRTLTEALPSAWVVEETASGAAPSEASAEASQGLDAIFEQLVQSSVPGMHHAAMDPYHITQRAIITDQLPDLIERVNARLPELEALGQEQYARLVRFFAHVVLYANLIELPLPAASRAPILNAYVGVLQRANESSELIALYASSLETEDAHVVYAEFLGAMPTDAPLEERRSALLQAQPHALDPAIVARCTVDILFSQLLSEVAESGATSDWDASLTANERRLIYAIDWLTFFEATFADAIVQSNRLMRVFMATGRLHAAHKLLQRLPAELVAELGAVDVRVDHVIELDHWRSYFDVLNKNVVVRGLWNDYCLSDSRAEQHGGYKKLAAAVEAARSANIDLLELGWLRVRVEDEDEARKEELALIRRRYIPEIVLSLHMMLVDTSQALPANLTHALRLPNLVADERQRLYAEFSGEPGPDGSRNLLRSYLEHVRNAALLAMDRRQDVLGCDRGVVA